MDKIFLNNVKESLQAEVDWETHRLIDKAIKELNDMRPNKVEGAVQIDEGIYEYKCKNCGNDFAWGDSAGENKYQYCQMCAEKRIAELEEALPIVKDVERNEELQKTVEKLQKELKSARVITPVEKTSTSRESASSAAEEKPNTPKPYKDVGGVKRKYERNCAYCGTRFATDIAEREYCCTEHLYTDIEDEETTQEMGIKPDRLSTKPKDVAKRSESQQLRRALEKQRPIPKTDCIQCGKLTTKKLYCSDKCRKEYELVIKKATKDSDEVWQPKPILPGDEKYAQSSGLADN